MPAMRVDDVTLHYERAGAGTPLLLLHGLGSWSEDWRAQREAFAARHDVIVPDLRGHGRSTRGDLSRFSLPRLAGDVAALLDALGGEPAHVVGLSMGGMVAFQLAVDAPRLVRSLTIVNSGPHVVPSTPQEARMLATRLRLAKWAGPGIVGRLVAPRLFPRPEHGHLRDAFRRRMRANDRRAYLAATRAIIGWSVLDRVGMIDVPTLVVAADQDYTPVAAKERYVALMRRAELAVVADARHGLPMEWPERFNAVLAGFLDRIDARAGATAC